VTGQQRILTPPRHSSLTRSRCKLGFDYRLSRLSDLDTLILIFDCSVYLMWNTDMTADCSVTDDDSPILK
jgi:hypothetical protein